MGSIIKLGFRKSVLVVLGETDSLGVFIEISQHELLHVQPLHFFNKLLGYYLLKVAVRLPCVESIDHVLFVGRS